MKGAAHRHLLCLLMLQGLYPCICHKLYPYGVVTLVYMLHASLPESQLEAFKQADNVHISATLRMACAISRAAVCLRMMIIIATMHSLLVVMHQLRGM